MAKNCLTDKSFLMGLELNEANETEAISLIERHSKAKIVMKVDSQAKELDIDNFNHLCEEIV